MLTSSLVRRYDVPALKAGAVHTLQARGMRRSIPPPRGSIRFRLALRAYDAPPWGVRVVSQTKSRKIPTRNILPPFFVLQTNVTVDVNWTVVFMELHQHIGGVGMSVEHFRGGRPVLQGPLVLQGPPPSPFVCSAAPVYAI